MKKESIEAMYRELDALAHDSIEGELGEKGSMRLRELFEILPGAHQRFAQHFYLDSALDEIFQSSPELRELVAQKRSKRTWAMGLGVAASLALLFALVVLQWRSEEPAMGGVSDLAIAEDSERFGVALLREAIDVQWAEISGEVRIDEPLQPRNLKLESGVARLEFYSGASVILEGPAQFELVSPELAIMHYGKVRAHVPPAAKGFTIRSKEFEILDLGTEFAVDVSRDGSAQVHVIDGEVVFTKEGAKGEHLIDGEGVSLDTFGKVSEIKALPSSFVGANEFKKLSYAWNRERLEEWNGLTSKLKNDPDAIAYYSFERGGEWGTSLVNEVGNADSGTDGTVVGCRWGEGRWNGNSALFFSKSSDRVRVKLESERPSLTMACWVFFNSIDHKVVCLFAPSTNQEKFTHWTVMHHDKKSAFHLVFAMSKRQANGKVVRDHFHCGTNIDFAHHLGRWLHLAVVYDGDKAEVSHFLDGELLEAIPVSSPDSVNVGTAELGNWPYRSWAAGTKWEQRHLNGAMDEFFILGRACSSEEIKEMFVKGRP